MASEPSLEAQRLAVLRLRATAEVTSLVPAANIFDRNSRPEVFPCIVLGTGQTIADGADCIDASEVFLDVHVWTEENTMAECKSIVGAVRRALDEYEAERDGYSCFFNFENAVFLRDPDGLHSHGVVQLRIDVEHL